MKTTPVDALTARRLGCGLPLGRAALEAAQLARVRQTVAWAMAGSAWYREHLAGCVSDAVRSLGDLGRLPFLTSAMLAEYGPRLVCVSQREVARIVTLQTSGSTGAPKRLHFTQPDLDGTLQFFREGMFSLVDGADRVCVLLPYALPDSTGDLLIRALGQSGIPATGCWPPPGADELAGMVCQGGYSCVVGLPQHVLGLAEAVPAGALKSVLLCSDYAPPALRARIEAACGCETFLHYGTTETGLGGAVECSAHAGCHVRESDLLVEIVDPDTGRCLPDGEVGEIVVTTLGRQAMPLVRYRTGDVASLERTPCQCGGITARLCAIRGRRDAHLLADGTWLASQDVDDALFAVSGVQDYRATLVRRDGQERLDLEVLAHAKHGDVPGRVRQAAEAAFAPTVLCGQVCLVAEFSASHTVKRTLRRAASMLI